MKIGYVRLVVVLTLESKGIEIDQVWVLKPEGEDEMELSVADLSFH